MSDKKPTVDGAALSIVSTPKMVQMTAPDDVTSISIGGVQYEVPESGELEAPEDIAAQLVSHGFKRASVRPEPEKVARRRAST